jgi:hypothetical protein
VAPQRERAGASATVKECRGCDRDAACGAPHPRHDDLPRLHLHLHLHLRLRARCPIGIVQPQVHDRAMPRIAFTPQLRRFTETPEVDTAATTLRAALEAAFALNPRLRGYVLDDQGHLRPNVVVFIDGRRCSDRATLADTLQPHSAVHVLQALSGG